MPTSEDRAEKFLDGIDTIYNGSDTTNTPALSSSSQYHPDSGFQSKTQTPKNLFGSTEKQKVAVQESQGRFGQAASNFGNAFITCRTSPPSNRPYPILTSEIRQRSPHYQRVSEDSRLAAVCGHELYPLRTIPLVTKEEDEVEVDVEKDGAERLLMENRESVNVDRDAVNRHRRLTQQPCLPDTIETHHFSISEKLDIPSSLQRPQLPLPAASPPINIPARNSETPDRSPSTRRSSSSSTGESSATSSDSSSVSSESSADSGVATAAPKVLLETPLPWRQALGRTLRSAKMFLKSIVVEQTEQSQTLSTGIKLI